MTQWVSDSLSQWVSDRFWTLSQWESDWVSDWFPSFSEPVSVSKYVGGDKNSVRGSVNESVDAWVNQWASESVSRWVSDRFNPRFCHQRIIFAFSMNESVSPWVSESVNEWFRESLREWQSHTHSFKVHSSFSKEKIPRDFYSHWICNSVNVTHSLIHSKTIKNCYKKFPNNLRRLSITSSWV